ncbi:6-hydroxymethylpterin diphosphokinase MptE-like protein [uncultured Methanobrevibacter sp.]|uniref:6-hydroxymethylpterin diphosphokinase MptE-like protein n=1 Tax=uncultured Methanobrevibacter sp. TaxID=253161 RepID=UPI002622AFE4|nr:6-hydroxymethylpterin diphosphokinase MptE-like protein [uncultured Methanobrevibacter sp.]
MDFGLWENYYKQILDDFGFERKDDEKTAQVLDDILFDEGCLTLEDLYEKINFSNRFIIFGAGPSLKKHIKKIKEEYDLTKYVLVSADGATTALIEEKIIPDIIATDLDGKIDDILYANTMGANLVIHGHGNNLEAILKYTPFFDNVLGTTQSQAHGNLYNFGGFTDGDRAMFLAIALGAKELILAGMDFGDRVTKYSRPNIENETAKADDIKLKKLEYAEAFTSWIAENKDVKIINLKL